MKLVQINSIVIGEQYKTNSYHSLRKESHTRQTLKLQPHSSHLLTAFFLQCFNLKKKERKKERKRREKKEKEKKKERKRKPTHCQAPYSSFIQSHSLCINYHSLQCTGSSQTRPVFKEAHFHASAIYMQSLLKFSSQYFEIPLHFCIL